MAFVLPTTILLFPPSPGPLAYEQFLMYVDHCFAIKGQGTVLTGTVLQGALAVGQTLHLPEFKVDKKAHAPSPPPLHRPIAPSPA